jgi:hypothetical protein
MKDYRNQKRNTNINENAVDVMYDVRHHRMAMKQMAIN